MKNSLIRLSVQHPCKEVAESMNAFRQGVPKSSFSRIRLTALLAAGLLGTSTSDAQTDLSETALRAGNHSIATTDSTGNYRLEVYTSNTPLGFTMEAPGMETRPYSLGIDRLLPPPSAMVENVLTTQRITLEPEELQSTDAPKDLNFLIVSTLVNRCKMYYHQYIPTLADSFAAIIARQALLPQHPYDLLNFYKLPKRHATRIAKTPPTHNNQQRVPDTPSESPKTLFIHNLGILLPEEEKD